MKNLFVVPTDSIPKTVIERDLYSPLIFDESNPYLNAFKNVGFDIKCFSDLFDNEFNVGELKAVWDEFLSIAIFSMKKCMSIEIEWEKQL